ncbi:MAG TPA: hypothetical protein VG817_12155 [Gemmatimonadales bacterium]|nr:hypothetical protein [Gemmatimonadales bacterium]
MWIINRVRGLIEWYRALRSLNRILATMSLVVLFASACGGDSNGPNNSASLRVANNADHSVWYVFVRDCGTSDWGDDLLGADVISIGETQTFAVGTGCKDVLLETDVTYDGSAQWNNQAFNADTTIALSLTEWSYAE